MNLIFRNRTTIYDVKDTDYEIWVKQYAKFPAPFVVSVTRKSVLALRELKIFSTRKELSEYLLSINSGQRQAAKLWFGEEI